jgi:hypothetical protein
MISYIPYFELLFQAVVQDSFSIQSEIYYLFDFRCIFL